MARRAAPGLWILVAAACSSRAPPLANPNSAPTPASHGYFPITTGPHATDCNTCHGPFPSFAQFSCFGCHGHEDQNLMGELHLGVPTYAYQSQACYTCHSDGARRPFDHAGLASGNGGCAACHDTGNLFAALPVAGFTHEPIGGADCGACHTTTSWLGATGAPPGASHDPTQDVFVDAGMPTYSGTSIAQISPQTEDLPMPMSHATGEISSQAMSACSSCHPDASSGSYRPGRLHASLASLGLAEPTSCADCHQTSMPLGFVGPVASSPARTPPSGEMKHDAVAWANGAPTTTSLVTADCGTCHPSPSGGQPGSWATGLGGTSPAVFHAALAAAGLSQPASCLDCHANGRPSTVLTSANSSIASNLSFDHTAAAAQGDCAACHASTTRWAGGLFHAPGSANPTTCLPCHESERPTSTASWQSPTYQASPFDWVTNGLGIAHGDGQDCAACHAGPGTGAWGGSQNWQGGFFPHGAATVAASSCIACHTTERPDLLPGWTAASAAAAVGFDHSYGQTGGIQTGAGDCVGCHQATVTAGSYVSLFNAQGTLPGGDWKGGQTYPGSTLVGSTVPGNYISVTEITLQRSGPANLVTGETSLTATLFNEMLHTASVIPSPVAPSPPQTNCWHCHASSNGTVTSYGAGLFHAALTSFTATPGGAVTGLPQPTSGCAQCHANPGAPNVDHQTRPTGIVERGGSELRAMDHGALFTSPVTINGATASGVLDLDCSTCHHSPGTSWADGTFHANIGSAVPADCVVCHYPLMADASAANLANGTLYRMDHASAQLVSQACAACHATALGNATQTPASTAWKTGLFHPAASLQPTACIDCHAGSEPTALTQSSFGYTLAKGATPTNEAQWMNHASPSFPSTGNECAACHLADANASGSPVWSKSDRFHGVVPRPAACQACHGLANGGGTAPGTGNNLPAGLTDATTVTSAASDPATGVAAGTLDQIDHADFNVTSHDCNFCHTQIGVSASPSIQGKEWAQASFHASFNGAALDTTTGRCSNCHLNVRPGPGITAFDHGALTSAPGSQDCSQCHSWPGTGTPSAPNWLGAAAGAPQNVTVGGFTIPVDGSTEATETLPHPSTASGATCATCHGNGYTAHSTGYDHAGLGAGSCNGCHEAGSPFLGSPWNGATNASGGAGDTRPTTLSSVTACKGGDCSSESYANHFYPVDCGECHPTPPTEPATTANGSTSNWSFPHDTGWMSNPSTCVMCHTNGIPN